ncbi:MAG TPA: Gfo/Idh/MocA family oxidoreductase [Gemmataceae bacterium]|nr:Gfo/Idh/MocA family oxidoreductase [Gemmataceae bacterium]
MAQRQLNLGMIGAGFMGQLAHLMNYVEIRACRVLGLAEFRPELRRKVAERYGIPRTYATHQELLRDADIEAVVVVTPRPYTAPVVYDCLQAGKHVLSEKPMAGTSEQGARLVECAKAQNLHYAVGHMKRFDEGVETAKRILDDAIASGSLGKVQFARAHCYMGDSYCRVDGHVVTEEKASYSDAGWPTTPDWVPAHWAKPYAAFVNTYSHNTNLLRYLFGKTPTVEHAHLSGPGGQIAVLNFGDFTATLETGRTSNRGWDEVTEVYFADGRLTLRTPPALLKNVPATVELYKAGAVQEIVAPQCNWTWSFRRQAEAFVNNILEVKESISSGAEALEDLRLIEEMWRVELARDEKNGPRDDRG